VKEIPDLIAVHNEFQSKGGMVIGISVDKDSDVLNAVAEFVKEKRMNYSVVIDNGDLEQAFGGIRGIPTTFMITKDGKIAKKIVGLQSKETYEKELNALL
jgi:cytochrome c biogenesis protein CcmG/thiol:disulfide interchange protein DsbE